MQAAPAWPVPGAAHFPEVVLQTRPAEHEPFTHESPAFVTAEQVPQFEVAEIAQKVDAHCELSPHAPPAATVPALIAQDAPNVPAANAEHERLGNEVAQVCAELAVAPVEGALSVGNA